MSCCLPTLDAPAQCQPSWGADETAAFTRQPLELHQLTANTNFTVLLVLFISGGKKTNKQKNNKMYVSTFALKKRKIREKRNKNKTKISTVHSIKTRIKLIFKNTQLLTEFHWALNREKECSDWSVHTKLLSKEP